MNKLTYKIYPSLSQFGKDFILDVTIWMNGQAISSNYKYYSTKWAAKRGLARFCKLLADNVKIVNVGVN